MHVATQNEKLEGPALALDLGQKRVGLAVSDSLLISITKLPPLERSSWKRMLSDVIGVIARFEVKTLVVGFPLGLNGQKGPAAESAQNIAEKFALSLDLPVYLQDERLTSAEAEEQLRDAGREPHEIDKLVDGQAAAIILSDFIGGGGDRILVSRVAVADPQSK